MEIDEPVPDFSLPATGKQVFSVAALHGKPFVLYFYPKDNTPGCTTEAGEFRNLQAQFEKLGCALFGISRDTLASHERFKAKLQLPFELIADVEETACTLFKVVRQKMLYGKPVRGVERSTFVIDAHGILRGTWRGVKAPGHAAEVLEFVTSLIQDK